MIGFEVKIGDKLSRMPIRENAIACIRVDYFGGESAEIYAVHLHRPSRLVERWMVKERIMLNQTIKIRYGELDGAATPPEEVRVDENMPEGPLLSRLEWFRKNENMLKAEGLLNEED